MAPAHRIHPPRRKGRQVTVPAGSLFAFEGRLARHGGKSYRAQGERCRFCSAPWLRQQENALAATSHDLLENADRLYAHGEFARGLWHAR